MLTELILFERALKEDQYHYFHLLSGLDLPIKTQDEIHTFFANTDLEYVGFNENNLIVADWKTKYYHFFVEGYNYRRNPIFKYLRFGFVLLQKIIGFKRKREFPIYYHGSQWISITPKFAEYIVSRKESLLKTYVYTICVSEIFVQTELKYSPFKGNEVEIAFPDSQNLRLIDWSRRDKNSPYTWRLSDWPFMKNSPFLFARKIDEKVDKELIIKIKNHVKKAD